MRTNEWKRVQAETTKIEASIVYKALVEAAREAIAEGNVEMHRRCLSAIRQYAHEQRVKEALKS